MGFLTSQVDNLEDYNSDRKDALAFDVKNMGYADYDEIDKAFKKLGHDDLDAQDFSEDIYEICQFDNETIFHDIEDYLEVPFYAMGRMGGHWGVLCEDVCDKDLVDVEINEKELWKYIEKNYDLNDYDDIWDIDCEDVGRYADENCFNFVADKDFVKHLNDAWDEIKKQSDYMLTYDYAEYIAERLIEDNFLESKNSTRKPIKESVDKTFFDWMCDKDFFKGISKQVTKKEKCQFDFYKTLDSYAWLITYKEGESLQIYMDKRTNDIFIHVNKNGKSGKDFKFPQLTFNDSVDELLDIIIRYVQGNFDSSWYESKKFARKSIKEQFVGKGEGGYRKPNKTKFNSGICLDSNGVKHTVIFDTRVEDFIVWVDNDNYLMWYVSSPQSLLNNLAESDLDENLILDIVALWEKLPKKRIKN